MKKITTVNAKSNPVAPIKKTRKGFTVPELIIVMSVFLILTGFVTVNLVNLERKTSLSTVVTTLISDLKQQQTKAMEGATEGRSSGDNYGIYFETNDYVLFHGVSYDSSDKSNFKVDIDASMKLTNILFPSGNIIFASSSGKIVGFVNGADSVSITNTESNTGNTIKINKYGVVTDVN